ncbi:uncharacterized protein I303_101298 [Kwoniella dejecticola CBS 10117]|uniref:Zn(2)-C6 fungal-type domain-containing protein n=1 Tax=Kwoniella dejecticola CBS 10117 TaxID=1296121 RepID=A0AAJ8KIM9_9TREE
MPRVASVSPHVARRPSPSITGAPQHVFVVSKNIAGPSQGQHQNTDAQTNVASVVEALNKRQPPSCDACRTRKLKCAGRPTVIELGLEATAVIPCEHCREWSLDCSYLYQRKRRGRKNRVVERLAEEQRARRQSQGGDAWAPGQVRPGTGGASSDSEEDSSERRESFNDGAGTRRDSFNGPPRRDSFVGGDRRDSYANEDVFHSSGNGFMPNGNQQYPQTSRDPPPPPSAPPAPPLSQRPSYQQQPLQRNSHPYTDRPPSSSSSAYIPIPQLYHQNSHPLIPPTDSPRPYYPSPPDFANSHPSQQHHPPQPPSSSTSHSHSFSYPAPHASHNPTIPPHQIHSHSNSHSYGGGPSSNTGPASLPSVASQDFVNSAPAPGAAGVNSTSPNNEVSPSVALSEASVPPSTSIESVLPREMAMNTIRLWFDHVHCIIPVIHRPSFMIDLSTHEEERRPMFFALIMGMIATTLIHVPKSYFGMSAENVRKLSDKCLKACYAVIRREMDNPNLELICIKYMIFIIHNKHGNVGLEAAAFGEAQYLAISLGLHREDTYYGLDPIESERRRRAWFLIYNADKFEAVARAKPVLLRPDEFLGPEATNFPTELDDKSITKQGYLPNSIPVPLISGFNILTRIVTILGDILVHERDIRRRPPKDPEELLSALRQVRQLQHRVKVIADKLPRPFQLEVGSGDIIPAPGWEEAIRDELDLFFSDPMSSETAKDGYLVLKANIHVTLAMTRLRLILHREDLLNRSGQVGTPSRNAAELVAADLGENVDWRHTVYQDLFKAVHGIPIQALAANGPSLVTKIRVVAVTLLDAMPSQEQADPNVQGIAAYLLDFLNIMSSIESQFAD